MNVVVEPRCALLECLESDEHFSLCADAALILLLVEDLVMSRVELVDLLVEVGARQATLVWVSVVSVPVAREIEVSRALRTVLTS